jgi:hypothetical protein
MAHCGTSRDGTTTAPMNAPTSPKYEPTMKFRWTWTRCVYAPHSAIERVPKVKIDSPWIQLKCPGRNRLITKELSTVQYIATTQTRPTQRCGRSPLARRSSWYAPSANATVAPPACSAITTLFAITLL